MAKFLDKARANGVPESIIERARESIEAVEVTVKLHAESRELFEAMISGFASESKMLEQEIEAKSRKAMFREAAVLWRSQCRYRTITTIMSPSETAGYTDRAMIVGYVGHRQNRLGVPLVQGQYFRPSRPQDPHLMRVEPLEASDDEHEPIGLLKKFCSHPLPTFHSSTDDEGITTYNYKAKTLGATGEGTFFSGQIRRAAEALQPDEKISFCFGFVNPVEHVIVDFLIHENLVDDRLPEVSVYKIPIQGKHFQEADRLLMHERVRYLGRDLGEAAVEALPRHTELLRYAFERTGWNPAEFRLFRCQIDYPVLHTETRFLFR